MVGSISTKSHLLHGWTGGFGVRGGVVQGKEKVYGWFPTPDWRKWKTSSKVWKAKRREDTVMGAIRGIAPL